MKIAVGTISKQKLGYLREVLDEIGVVADVAPVKVESGVSDQPITEDETQTGSMNRAKAAFENTPSADFGIGIEVGYHKNKNDDYEIFCCTSIIGKGNLTSSCFSSKFLLPDFHQNILKENKKLGEHVRDYHKTAHDPVIDYVRELVRGRRPLIVEATRNALLNYLETFSTVKQLLASGDLGYRDKSLGIVIDKDHNFLLVQLVNYGENDWNFSGGGIEEGETPEDAVLRELREELGSDKFKIISRSAKQIEYDWPEFIIAKDIKKRANKKYRGQRMNVFLVEFVGKRSDISPDPIEIKNVKWVDRDDLKTHLHFANQWKQTEEILKELL